MSIPAFGWAMQQGRLHKLPTSERMLLVVIADRQNGYAHCTASQECLANDTGLKERQVRISLRRLEELGLITTTRAGKSRLYSVVRQGNGADHTAAHNAGVSPAHTAGKRRSTPAHTAGKTPVRRAGVQRTTPARDASTPAQCAETPAHTAAKPYSNQENLSPRARREPPPPLPDGRSGGSLPPVSNGTPPPVPPAKAPQLGVATDGGSVTAFRPPGQPPDPFADGGASKDWMSRRLGRPVHLDAESPEVVTEDDVPQTPEDRARMAAQLGDLAKSLAHRWQNNYPPRQSPLDAQEQIAVVLEPPRAKAYFLNAEQLLASNPARRAAAARPPP